MAINWFPQHGAAAHPQMKPKHIVAAVVLYVFFSQQMRMVDTFSSVSNHVAPPRAHRVTSDLYPKMPIVDHMLPAFEPKPAPSSRLGFVENNEQPWPADETVEHTRKKLDSVATELAKPKKPSAATWLSGSLIQFGVAGLFFWWRLRKSVAGLNSLVSGIRALLGRFITAALRQRSSSGSTPVLPSFTKPKSVATTNRPTVSRPSVLARAATAPRKSVVSAR